MAFLAGKGEGERSRVRRLASPTRGLGFLFISTMCSSAYMSISADSASLVCKKETVVVMLDTRDLLMDTFKVDTGMLYNQDTQLK